MGVTSIPLNPRGRSAGPQQCHPIWEPAARLQAGLPAWGVLRGGKPPSGTAGSNWWDWDRVTLLPAQPEQMTGNSLQGAEVNTCHPPHPPEFS